MKYYDGTKLLSLKDQNGKRPEIYISTKNRTAGKTTFFNRYYVKSFLQGKGQFLLLFRKSFELQESEKPFFDKVQFFFPEYRMYGQSLFRGYMRAYFIQKNDEPEQLCGYGVYINNPELVKHNSALFENVNRMMLDEFQTLDMMYCEKEVEKVISIHTSVARGQGQANRYVPLHLVGNNYSIINPYYSALGIQDKLHKDTIYYRGNGLVLEQGFMENIAESMKESTFMQAFTSSSYVEHATDNVYYMDSDNLLEVIKSENKRYFATVVYDNISYAVYQVMNRGVYYVDKKVDNSYPLRITTDSSSHNSQTIFGGNIITIKILRDAFNKGLIRFKDIECKNAIIKSLSIF